MSHAVYGPLVLNCTRKELRSKLDEEIMYGLSEEYPQATTRPKIVVSDYIGENQEAAQKWIDRQCNRMHTDYIVVAPFKSNGSLDTFKEQNPKKFEELSKKAMLDFADWKNVVTAEMERLGKQAYITCPDCGSKINASVFLKNNSQFPGHIYYSSEPCDCTKYGLERGCSSYTFEASFEDSLSRYGMFECPVCRARKIGGKTYVGKLERLAKKHDQNVAKIYQLASKQKERVVYLVKATFYIG